MAKLQNSILASYLNCKGMCCTEDDFYYPNPAFMMDVLSAARYPYLNVPLAHPQSNVKVERMLQKIKNSGTKGPIKKPDNWERILAMHLPTKQHKHRKQRSF
jgi:hypothetical protein